MHDPEQIKGYELTDALIDEFDVLSRKKQDTAWEKIIARVRRVKGGTISIGTTPEGFRKTYEIFVEKGTGNLYQADTRNNPYLPDDYIEGLKDQYSGKLLEQYLKGRFVNLKGLLAYYGFDREKHTAELMKNPPINCVHIGMDFNVDPMSAVLSYWNGTQLCIFDEVSLPNSNTFQMTEYINRRFSKCKVVVYPDMTGKSRKTSAKMSDIKILKKAGFQIKGSHNSVHADSLNAVNKAFQDKKICIDKRCIILMGDFDKVITNEYRQIDKADSSITHMSDAFRYLVERNFPFIKPKLKTGVA